MCDRPVPRSEPPPPKRTHRSRHPYIFKSLVHCGICGRKMRGQHSHGVAYYRCRFPQEYAPTNKVDHPRNVIMREDVLIDPLDTWLVQGFGAVAPPAHHRHAPRPGPHRHASRGPQSHQKDLASPNAT
ncbi:zinc ribbon domain-containing protein [Micromonospora sp. C31]|uniref:zinc ribbon domain-containing protein n=1 Tax=Micromonospora sp. C31 TaxID=2824876 RepID=UPI001B39A50A|nr:zinc ribbon domain-containing protein [Micromonospora sp. C31]